MIAHLNRKRLRTHGRNGSISDLIHRFRNRDYMIGPHHQTPEALLGITDCLIDEFDFGHFSPLVPECLRQRIRYGFREYRAVDVGLNFDQVDGGIEMLLHGCVESPVGLRIVKGRSFDAD